MPVADSNLQHWNCLALYSLPYKRNHLSTAVPWRGVDNKFDVSEYQNSNKVYPGNNGISTSIAKQSQRQLIPVRDHLYFWFSKSTGLGSTKSHERMTQFPIARTGSPNRVFYVSCAKGSAFGNAPKKRALSIEASFFDNNANKLIVASQWPAKPKQRWSCLPAVYKYFLKRFCDCLKSMFIIHST